MSQLATGRDIIINAIYAGNRAQGIKEMWQAVAQYGGGTYAAIEMDEGTYQIPAPQDAMLQKLNIELNVTYLPFGAKGKEGRKKQLDQDDNAARMGEQSANSRVQAKASMLYDNAAWDLVDAVEEKDFRLDSVKKEALPEAMQSMSIEEREAFVGGMRVARGRVQRKIQKLSKDRDEFLKKERARQKTGDKSGLDEALLKSIREHAEKKGFKFSDK